MEPWGGGTAQVCWNEGMLVVFGKQGQRTGSVCAVAVWLVSLLVLFFVLARTFVQ